MNSELDVEERIEALQVGVSIALTVIVDQLVSTGVRSPENIRKSLENQLNIQREVQSNYPEYQTLYDGHNYFLEQMYFHCNELIQSRSPDSDSPSPKGRPSWFRGIYTGGK